MGLIKGLGNFVVGVGEGAVGTVKSAAHGVAHPIKTVEKAAMDVAHPVKTAERVAANMVSGFEASPAKFLGSLVGSSAVMAAVPMGAAGIYLKVTDKSEAAGAAEAASVSGAEAAPLHAAEEHSAAPAAAVPEEEAPVAAAEQAAASTTRGDSVPVKEKAAPAAKKTTSAGTRRAASAKKAAASAELDEKAGAFWATTQASFARLKELASKERPTDPAAAKAHAAAIENAASGAIQGLHDTARAAVEEGDRPLLEKMYHATRAEFDAAAEAVKPNDIGLYKVFYDEPELIQQKLAELDARNAGMSREDALTESFFSAKNTDVGTPPAAP